MLRVKKLHNKPIKSFLNCSKVSQLKTMEKACLSVEKFLFRKLDLFSGKNIITQKDILSLKLLWKLSLKIF